MYQKFITDLLHKKQRKAYTLIVEHYRNVITELKPTLFRSWLANELNISIEIINQSSLNSAYRRIIKSPIIQNERGKKHSPSLQIKKETIPFKFSDPDKFVDNSTIEEL